MMLSVLGVYQILNETVKRAITVLLGKAEVFKELVRVSAAKDGIVDLFLCVLKAPDRVKAIGSRLSHEVAVMLQIDDRIWQNGRLDWVDDAPRRFTHRQGALLGDDLFEPLDSPVPSRVSGILLQSLASLCLTFCHRAFVGSNSDSTK